MSVSTFFRLFPPPKLLAMKYFGLDISDDAVYSLEYALTMKGWVVDKHTNFDLPKGVISAGEIVDEATFLNKISEGARANGWTHVKVSIPEEKVYLFQIDVPSADMNTIKQNIESKLEENVPLSARDAVFYFDLLPLSVTGGVLRASVSVVATEYIERYITLLKKAGVFPIAFETVPKALARAIVPPKTDRTELIVNAMKTKTGMYIVSGGVACFTSTVGVTDAPSLGKEIDRIYAYWSSRIGDKSTVSRILLVGENALSLEHTLAGVSDSNVPVEIANIWTNVFDIDSYIPPISHDDSLKYAVAAGLAISR